MSGTDKLSPSVHKQQLKQIIKDKLDPIQPVTTPRLFMLGGQPGAGKSAVRQGITTSPQGTGSLVIDPDELRTYHPNYLKFVKENPDTAAGRVHPDAAAWASELRAAAIAKKVNIIFDGTLGGSPKASVGMVDEASGAGYQVEVHVVAVSLEVSQQSVRKRYEEAFVAFKQDPKNNPPPRNVPDGIQQGSYNNIPGVIEALAATGKVSRLRVADRSGKKLSDISGKHAVTEDGGKSGSTALKQERNRPWTVKEIEAFAKNGKDTEKLLQDRINDSKDRGEKGRLQKELVALQTKNQDAVDDKQDMLTSARPERDAWIKKYAGFKFPKKKK